LEDAVQPTAFRRALRVVRVIFVNLLVFAVLAELVSLIFVNRQSWPSSRPNYHLNHTHFWIDADPATGHWHPANGRFLHQDGCFSVEYTTNSYGARDIERTLHSAQPRTIVLGDSMMEGMGLPAGERLSDLLEKHTGREHLNFGIAGTGPLQYALLYKTKAAEFDHDLVLVGVLPFNDFHDMDVAYAKAHGKGDYYRPYYADDFSIFYTGHFDANHRGRAVDYAEDYLRAYLASYHVYQYVENRLIWSAWADGSRPYSGFNDFTPVDLERLKHALLDIKSIADQHHARVAVLLIPFVVDYNRLHSAHEDRLGPVMEAWGREVGISVKDLLPPMDADSGGDYRSYHLLCDGHWSARGTTEAEKIVEPWLYSDSPSD
jgi:hypothetical protein